MWLSLLCDGVSSSATPPGALVDVLVRQSLRQVQASRLGQFYAPRLHFLLRRRVLEVYTQTHTCWFLFCTCASDDLFDLFIGFIYFPVIMISGRFRDPKDPSCSRAPRGMSFRLVYWMSRANNPKSVDLGLQMTRAARESQTPQARVLAERGIN